MVALSGINLTLSIYRSIGSLRPVGLGSDFLVSFLCGTHGSSLTVLEGGAGVGTGVGVFFGVGCLKHSSNVFIIAVAKLSYIFSQARKN